MSRLSHIFLIVSVLYLSFSMSVDAIQTSDVEIGVSGVFDGAVHIGRDAGGVCGALADAQSWVCLGRRNGVRLFSCQAGRE